MLESAQTILSGGAFRRAPSGVISKLPGRYAAKLKFPQG